MDEDEGDDVQRAYSRLEEIRRELEEIEKRAGVEGNGSMDSSEGFCFRLSGIPLALK